MEFAKNKLIHFETMYSSYSFIKRFFSILFLLIISLSSFTQTLEEDQQEIIKEFEAQLEDAQRVVVKPTIQPVVVTKKSYNYNVTIIPLELKYPDPIIKPLAADPDLPFESKKFYAKLGYGNLQNPFARIMFYKSDQNKTDYFFDVKHYGLNNASKKLQQSMSNSQALLGINLRPRENRVVTLKMDGALDKRKFYFDANSDQVVKDFGKGRDRLNLKADFEMYNPEETASGLDYKINLGYSLINFLGTDKKSELAPHLGLFLAKSIGKWKISFPLNIKSTLQSSINDLYAGEFSPSLKMSSEKLWLSIGASIFYDPNLKSKFWPLIHADYAIKGKYFHLFLDANQKWMMNNLHNLSQQNPWLNVNLPELATNLLQTASAGLKSENNFIGLEAELGYAQISNQANYLNINNEAIEKADVKNVKTNSVFFKSSLEFVLSDNIEIGGKVIKHFFTEKLFGVPSIEFSAFSKLSFLKNKVVINPMLTLRDRSIAYIKRVNDFEEKKLNNQVDLSTEAQVNFSKKASLYLQANNILNNLYVPFYGYPVVGIHFQGGLILKF